MKPESNKHVHQFLHKGWRWYCCQTGRRCREIAPELNLSLRSLVRSQGGRLYFDLDAIRIIYEGTEMLFGYDVPYLLEWELKNLRGLWERMVFQLLKGKLVADCRAPAEYRVPYLDGVVVSLPRIAESANVAEGYCMKGRPREGDLVFDVGAYCGETVAVLSRLVGPRGRVVAFEPACENLRWLSINVAKLKLANVTIVENAMWSHRTQLSLTSNAGADVRGTTEPMHENAMTVAAIGLADAISEYGVPDFVKMDIEGAEIDVLEGARTILPNLRARFAIASYHTAGGKLTSELLEPIFERAGFSTCSGYNGHRTTWAWRES